ncbi:MAG TPA: 30S ribosomal protein S6, partial [Blastocatellia bacterium]|nr:30S ribosomal protein S6 [Blastocatellia bacterium]
GAEIAEIERRMRVLDPIIRYITIRIDEDLKRAEKLRKKRSTRVRPTVRRSSRPGAHAAPPAEEED